MQFASKLVLDKDVRRRMVVMPPAHEPLGREKVGRQVSTTIFDRKELANRLKKRDHFVSKVFAGLKIFLIGDEARLRDFRVSDFHD